MTRKTLSVPSVGSFKSGDCIKINGDNYYITSEVSFTSMKLKKFGWWQTLYYKIKQTINTLVLTFINWKRCF